MLATLKVIAIVAAAFVVVVLLAGRLGLFSGKAPSHLGVRDGRFKPPSKTPNSVSSQARLWPDSAQHETAQIAPLALIKNDGAATLMALQAIAEVMPGAKVVEARADYLYVQFSTRLMGYTDDAEFWFDSGAQVVQLRSASRVGRKDFDVNRARIEAMRARLLKLP